MELCYNYWVVAVGVDDGVESCPIGLGQFWEGVEGKVGVGVGFRLCVQDGLVRGGKGRRV